MSSQQVKTILDRARAFHRELSAFYDTVQNQADKQRVKMLLTYFSHHEMAVEEGLAKFEKTLASEVLETWFKCPSEKADHRSFDSILIKPDMNVEQALEVAMQMDDCILALYQGCAETAGTEEVRDVFRTLVKLTERERKHYLKQGVAIQEL